MYSTYDVRVSKQLSMRDIFWSKTMFPWHTPLYCAVVQFTNVTVYVELFRYVTFPGMKIYCTIGTGRILTSVLAVLIHVHPYHCKPSRNIINCNEFVLCMFVLFNHLIQPLIAYLSKVQGLLYSTVCTIPPTSTIQALTVLHSAE